MKLSAKVFKRRLQENVKFLEKANQRALEIKSAEIEALKNKKLFFNRIELSIIDAALNGHKQVVIGEDIDPEYKSLLESYGFIFYGDDVEIDNLSAAIEEFTDHKLKMISKRLKQVFNKLVNAFSPSAPASFWKEFHRLQKFQRDIKKRIKQLIVVLKLYYLYERDSNYEDDSSFFDNISDNLIKNELSKIKDLLRLYDPQRNIDHCYQIFISWSAENNASGDLTDLQAGMVSTRKLERINSPSVWACVAPGMLNTIKLNYLSTRNWNQLLKKMQILITAAIKELKDHIEVLFADEKNAIIFSDGTRFTTPFDASDFKKILKIMGFKVELIKRKSSGNKTVKFKISFSH